MPSPIGAEHVETFRWTPRDVQLYALGVGAGVATPRLVLGRWGPVVLPTWATVLAMPAVRRVVDELARAAEVVIHDTMALSCGAPLPPSGIAQTTARIVAVYDLKRMLRVDVHARTTIDGALVADSRWGLLLRGVRVEGAARPPLRPRVGLPDRPPDFVHVEATSPDQALLYHLNGDDNPIHLEADAAKRAGLPGPILHGLCIFGIAGRVCLEQLCDGDPSRFEALEGSFARPVQPGAMLVVRGWREPQAVRVSVAGTDETELLANGWARTR